jgi:23S rRNA (pseudouridine1915-N3)-methyltransferase
VRVLVAAVGKASPGPERELVDRYHDRLAKAGRGLGLTKIELAELSESRARSSDERRTAEADALLRLAPDPAVVIALDERGESLPSETLARRLDAWRSSGAATLAFFIGGPDGHGRAVLDRASVRLAFGAATWPHLLVRAMLLEQLYRAVTILAGHPYHRP